MCGRAIAAANALALLVPSPRSASKTRVNALVPGERLSWLSSALPWPIVSENGIEDGQELSSDGDESGHLGFSGGNEAVEEGLQDRIVPFGDHGTHEQDGAHGCATAADEASAAPLAGLACERSKARERSNLLAVELPELRQFSNQRSCDGRPHTRYRSKQVFLLAPSWRAPHGIVDVRIEAGQFLLQRLEEPCDALAQMRDRQARRTLPFGPDHLDDLPPASNEISQQ